MNFKPEPITPGSCLEFASHRLEMELEQAKHEAERAARQLAESCQTVSRLTEELQRMRRFIVSTRDMFPDAFKPLGESVSPSPEPSPGQPCKSS